MLTDLTNKAALNKFQDAAVKALALLAKEHGVTVRAAGGSIKSAIVADLKFEFKVDNQDVKAAVEKSEFGTYCKLYGLLPEDYGTVFTVNGKTYRLVGFNLSRPKFCIRVTEESGKEVLFGETVVPKIIAQRKAA